MDNNLNADIILAVVRKLIGDIKPCGDSSVDSKRIQNLDNLVCVVDGLLRDVERVAVLKERHENSINVAGVKADNALTDWHAYIEEYFTTFD